MHPKIQQAYLLVGRVTRAFVTTIKLLTRLAAKPFMSKAASYPVIDLDASDQEKISRDFSVIGKDLYMSLDEYEKNKPKHA